LSPMVERAREHARLDTAAPAGERFALDGLLPRPITIYVPSRAVGSTEPQLVVHFNGAPYVAMHAVAAQTRPTVLASVHLGAGSGVYERAFADGGIIQHIRHAVADSLSARAGVRVQLPATVLSGFSAGYGAIRAILRDPAASSTVDAVLLLDGLHVSYVPERTPLAEGG